MLKILLLKTLRDVRRSVAQSIALMLIVAVGVASFVALIGAYRDLGSSYAKTYAALAFADLTVQVLSAPEEAVGRLRSVPGVAAVTGRLIVDTGMVAPAGSSADSRLRARLIGVPGAAPPEVDAVSIEQGRAFTGDDGRSAIVEAHFAKAYGIKPGETIKPIVDGAPVNLDVVGVAASPEYLIVSSSRQDVIPDARHFAVLFVPLRSLQQLLGSGPVVNDFALLLDRTADPQRVLARVRSELSSYGIETVTWKKDQPSNAALKLDLDGYRQIGILMPALILIAAAAALFVMLGRQIRAQETQIGLLRALGYGRAAILVHYLFFACLVGLFGSILGIAAGVPLGELITTAYAGELGIPLVQTRLYADLLLEASGLSIVVALAAGVFPARRAASLLPAKAMRADPADALARGGRTIFDRLLPLSVWSRLPFRNAFRARGRALSTLVGTVFAFVLVLTSWALIDSMQRIVFDTFHRVEQWDVHVSYSVPQPDASLAAVRSIPGVRAVEPLLQLPVSVSAAAAPTGRSDRGAARPSEELLLTALDPSQRLHEFRFVARGANPFGASSIVLTSITAQKLGITLGDEVTVTTPFGSAPFTVGALVNEMMSSVAYVSTAAAARWVPLNTPVYNGLYLATDHGGANALVAKLYSLPDVSNVELKSSTENAWNSLMALYYMIMAMILAFALVMAWALLFNAMTVNVLEQQREIATMRSIGASGSRIAAVVLTEAVLLWLVALVPGIVLGALTARGMGYELNSDLFSISVTVSPRSVLITAVGVLAVMLLSCAPAIRRATRLNLAVATKTLA